MVKKGVKLDFKLPILFITEELNEQGETPVVVKLQHTADGSVIPNPTTECLPLFYQGNIEQFLKWVLSLKYIMIGHTVRERYAVALQALKGTDKDLCQRELNTPIVTINNFLTSEQVKECLVIASLDRLTDRVIKDK
jgi:hypothetical protein